MPILTTTLPADGDTADASDISVPVLAILALLNGGLDDANIASMSGTKLNPGTVPASAMSAATNTGWIPMTQAMTYGSNNGQKEFTITTPSDLTGVLSPGMRFRLSRATTPPTQCMSFAAASSQYGTKTSPTGISFTNNFTCEAWVYLNSYTAGAGVISRWDGTNGFLLYLDGSGRLVIQGGNGAAGRAYVSTQSIPLNRWVHVAGALNMAAPTGSIYINGALVPSALTGGGTGTSLTQAGNLQVGAFNSSNFLDGKIAEARIWSVIQSQSAIQSNMAISLVGTEANLVALFQGNGNFNDKTSNANNLTATGGAVATTVDNPYHQLEYALVTKVSYSAPNTTVTLFTGTDYMVPNQALNAPAYSTQRAPFGFPTAEARWMVDTWLATNALVTIAALNTWYAAAALALTVPIGEWTLGYNYYFEVNATVASSLVGRHSLGVSTTAVEPELTVRQAVSAASTFFGTNVTKERGVALAAQTTYSPLVLVEGGSGTLGVAIGAVTVASTVEVSKIYARSRYL